MTHTTAVVLACVFAALALIAAIFVKKRPWRIVLTVVCAVAVLLCVVWLVKAAQADDEIKKEALERVSDDIEFATDIIENTKFSDSQVTYPYERKPDESYSKLTGGQKKLYDEILPKVQKIEDFTYSAEEYGYSTLDDLLIVMGALNEDHPELELYFLISEVIDGDTTTALASRYFMPGGGDVKTKEQKDELRHELAVFDAECDAIVAGMPEGDAEIMGRESWAEVAAVKTGMVLNADADAFSRPGPRLKDAAISLYNFINGIEEVPDAA